MPHHRIARLLPAAALLALALPACTQLADTSCGDNAARDERFICICLDGYVQQLGSRDCIAAAADGDTDLDTALDAGADAGDVARDAEVDTDTAQVDTDAAEVDTDAGQMDTAPDAPDTAPDTPPDADTGVELDADTALDTRDADTALDTDAAFDADSALDAPDTAPDADAGTDTALDADADADLDADTGADTAPDADAGTDADADAPVELPPRIDIHVTGFALGLLSAGGNPWDPDEGTPPTPELRAALADLVAAGDWFALIDWLGSGILDDVTPPDAYATLRYNDGLGWTDSFEADVDRIRTDTYLVTDYMLVVRDVPSAAEVALRGRDHDGGSSWTGTGEFVLTPGELLDAYRNGGPVWFYCGDRTGDSCLLVQLAVSDSAR